MALAIAVLEEAEVFTPPELRRGRPKYL